MASPSADAPLLTSRSGRVRTAGRLARRTSRAEQRLFLAEGPQAVREALTVPGCVREIFAAPGAAATHPEIRVSALDHGLPWQLVDDTALAALTETVHPQGLVAVCRFLDEPFLDLLSRRPGLLAFCVDVRDPGNAGTVVRCADAAGAGGVVLAGSSVDPYNGKAVRASAGSLFHLPLAVAGATPASVASAVQAMREDGMTVLAADGTGELDLDDAADDGLLVRRTAWVFGNEAWGLREEVAALADHRVRIPIHGRAESLNLATAAAVCLYASARAQRRPRPAV
ncbi:MAG TPA: RNA methyltransferase [Nocardioidaceae bacterium]|nr:RNA methyltransferase [Nocardioidaceae bacterium]